MAAARSLPGAGSCLRVLSFSQVRNRFLGSFRTGVELCCSKMVSHLVQFLTPLGAPIALLWLLHLCWALLLLKSRKWQQALVPAALCIFLWVFGSTPLPARMLATLERPQVRLDADAIPTSDVIVMLG